MEIIAQWLDDLDDLLATVGLLTERLRNFCIAAAILGASVTLQLAAVALALRHPPLACAVATMLLVFLMYQSATAPRSPVSATA
ncbi:MAG: hypothetical protein ACR2QS_05000 [Woeseiaceae bacterium]